MTNTRNTARRITAAFSAVAVAASIVTITNTAAVQAAPAPPGGPFIETFDDDNEEDFSATTADWNSLLRPAGAQPSFDGLQNNALQVSPDFAAWGDTAVGDVNGDGDDDVVAVGPGIHRWYAGDGDALPFDGVSGVDIGAGIPASAPSDVELADVDGDGDLDALVVYPAGNPGLVVYENNGSADPFVGVAPRLTANTVGLRRVEAAHLDGDTDIDIVVVGERLWFFPNNGSATPFFAQMPVLVSAVENTSAFVLADMNRDGEVDIVASTDTGEIRYYENQPGATAFGSGNAFDVVRSGGGFEADTMGVGDLDGNGTLEVFVETFQETESVVIEFDFDGAGVFQSSNVTTMALDIAQNVTDVEIVDVDNDGDRDIVQIAQESGARYRYRWFRNPGTERWWTTAAPTIASESPASQLRTLSIADFDRDGDLDSFIGASGSTVASNDILRYYENDGTTSLGGERTTLVGAPIVSDIVSLDIDADGDLDYVVSSGSVGNVDIYRNDGDGTFAAPVGVGGDGVTVYTDLAVGDVDGNGRPDVAAVGVQPDTADNVIVFIGEIGDPGGLTLLGQTAAPNSRTVLLADFNGDGRDDLAVGAAASVASSVRFNDGTGPDLFDAIAPVALGGTLGFDVDVFDAADLDDDGRPDLLAGVQGSGARFTLFFATDIDVGVDIGTGTTAIAGSLIDRSPFGNIDVVTQTAAGEILADRNVGGGAFFGNFPFLVFSGAPGIAGLDVSDGLVFVDGEAVRTQTRELSTGEAVAGFTVGDFDGDGDSDVIVVDDSSTFRFDDISTGPSRVAPAATDAIGLSVNASDVAALPTAGAGRPSLVYVGDTGVVLIEAFAGEQFPYSASNTTVLSGDTAYVEVATGDVDNDGDTDVVAAKENGEIARWRNDGAGAFFFTSLTFDAVDEVRALELADINGDNDLDVVVLQEDGGGSIVRALVGTGAGGFPGTPSLLYTSASTSLDIALADLDRDGDPDLVIANAATDHEYVLNSGGVFPPGGGLISTTTAAGTAHLATGDVNGDGAIDIVIGQPGLPSTVFFNDPIGVSVLAGSGTAVTGAATAGRGIALVDIDGDGVLDLVSSSLVGQAVEVAYGDGTAAFDGGTKTLLDGNAFGAVTPIEVDRDRGAELVVIDPFANDLVVVQSPAVFSEAADQARSGTVDSDADQILTATATFVDAGLAPVPNINEVDLWLTNNGGINWFQVDAGETFAFPTVGSDLRWRTDFADNRLADADSQFVQAIDDLRIDFTLPAAIPTIDVDLSANPGTAQAGPNAVPLGALAPEVIQEAAADDATTDIAAAPLGSLDLTDAPENTSIAASPLGSIPLGSIPIESLPLGSIPLTDVAVDAPGGWDGIIERARATGETQIVGAPLQNVTLDDVAGLAEVQALPLGSIDLGATPLGSIPLGSIALGALPLGSIPIGDDPDPLVDWCVLLESPEFGFDCGADFGITPGTPDDTTLIDLAVQGAPLGSIPLGSIPLGSIPLGSIPLGSIPLGSIDIEGTPLGSIPLGSIPLGSIPLGSIPLGSIPLGSIPLGSIPLGSINVDGRNVGATPLGSIDIAASPLGSIPLGSIPLGSIPLGSLPLGSIPLGSLPLGSIPLGSIDVAGTPLGSIPLGSIDIQGSPLGSIPLGSIDIQGSPLGSIPLGSIPLGSIPLGSIPLGSIQLDSLPLGSIPLGSIPLGSIDIAGTPLGSIPLGSIAVPNDAVDCSLIDCDDPRNTLFQAVLNDAVRGTAPLDVLDGALAGIRHDDIAGAIDGLTREQYETDLLASLDDPGAPITTLLDLVTNGLLDDLTLGDLPETLDQLANTEFGALVNGLAGLDYDALGTLLADVTLPPGDATQITDFDDLTLAELEDPVDGFDTPFFNGFTLADVGDELFQLSLEDLASIFQINLVQLQSDLAPSLTGDLEDLTTFEGMTLSDLLVYEGTTLAELFESLTPPNSNEGIFDDIFLGELLVGLLAVADYPWDIVDFTSDDLVSFEDAGSNIEYTALVSTADATGETAELRVTLPLGAPYVPGSTSITGAPDAEPEVQGSDLVWQFPVVSPATAILVVFEARPPLNLATHPAEATARLINTSIEASSLGSFSLVEANEPNDTIATATPISEDNAYFAHITSGDDIDLFAITVPAVGSRLSINLSNLDADLDLALFAPPGGGLLGAQPQDSIVPVDDDGLNALVNDDEVDAQVAQDLSLVDLPLHQTSLQRGLGEEQIDTAPLNRSGTWYLQVSGFNDATTVDPYVLRAKVLAPIANVPCDPRTFPFTGTPGIAPAVDPSVDTLFLINEERIGQLYGPTEATAIRTRLDDMIRAFTAPSATDPDLTALGIDAAVVSVEADPAVAAAYSAWDGTDLACSPDAANDVVAAISDVVEGIRTTNDLRHIVVIGGDELIPFARVPDFTTIANERSYASTFAGENNALVGALAGGFVLTDDVYGDSDPIAFGDRTLFVPDVALGRLVETPSEILGTLDGFLGHGGTLDPDTALVTGYDFLTDGADAIIEGLEGALTDAAGNPIDPTALNNDVWGRTDLRDALVPATGDSPDVASVNAHFDHYRALPADGNATQDESDLFEVADLEQGIPGGLEASIVFSMGCHSGYTVNDELVPFGDVRAGDWAQALSSRGAIYVGNTGYGYGDTEIVAYSEELMARFAGNLDGSVTAGEALMFAKNAYIGGLAAVGVYDEKSAMQATFYGLPFYSIDEVAPPPPPVPALVPTPDPLASDILSESIDLDETFVRVDGPDGSYWFWDDAGEESTQAVHFRPIQPKVIADVTAADPSIEARGAMLTDLASIDVPGVDPVIVRPTIDLGENEPEPDTGQIADPAVLQTITSEFTSEGDRQRFVTSGGQFRGTAEGGVERLFTTIDADVYYASDTESDRTPPTIGAIDGVVLGSDVNISVDVSDTESDVVRVNILYVVDPGPGVTTQWELVEFARDPGTDTWTGAVPDAGGEIEYFVQALDAAGNVAVSSDKGSFYNAEEAAPPPVDLTPMLARSADSNGWFTAPVSVSIPDPSPFTVTVSVSGGAPVTYTGPVTIDTGGNRRVVFRRNDGLTAEIVVAMDLASPIVTVSEPRAGAAFPEGTSITTAFTCADAGSGIATCVGSVDGQSVGSGGSRNDYPIGTHTLTVIATDIAGNTSSSSRTFEVVADETAPTASINAPANGALVAADVAFDFDCADELPGVSCTGTLDGATPVADGQVVTLPSGAATLVVDAVDAAGNTTSASSTFTVDADAPLVVISSPESGSQVALAASITVDFDCSDPNGVVSCTATLDGDPVADGDVVAGLALGDHTVIATGVDVVGNVSNVSSTFAVADETAPTVSISSPADGSIVSSEVTFEFDCADDVLAGLTCTGLLDDATPVVDGETLTLSSGSSTLVVTATDSAGNTASASSTFVVDGDAPTITITSPVDGAEFGFPASVTVDFDCADPNGVASCTATLDGSPVADGDVVTGLAIGDHSLVVTAVDQLGNERTEASTFTIVDQSAPTIAVTSPLDGSTVGTEITVSFSCVDDVDAAPICEGLIDGVTPVTDGDVIVLASGAHTLVVTGVDAAGNTADASSSFTTVEADPPVVTIVEPADGAVFGVAGDPLVEISATCVDAGSGAAGCSITVDGVPVGIPGSVSAVANIATGSLSFGDHVVVVTGVDNDGNSATGSVTFTVVDDVVPTVSISSPLDGSVVGSGVAFGFDCGDNVAAGVTCVGVLDGVTPVADGETLTLSSGSYTLVVTATDAAGNVSTVASTFDVDADGPAVSILSPVDGAEFGFPASVSIDFDCSDPNGLASCTATVDGVAVSDGDLVTGLAVGPHTVVVTGVDQLGTVATASTTFAVVDDTAPSITIAAPADGSTVGTDVTFEFSCVDDVDPSPSCEGLIDGVTAVTAGDAATLGSGSHTVMVTSVDASGNTATASSTFIVEEDVAPVVTILEPADGAVFGLASDPVISISATCIDAGSGSASCSITLDGDPIGVSGSVSAVATVQTDGLTFGDHVVVVTGVDNDGNSATGSVTFTVVDDVVPTVSISSPLDGSVVGSGVAFGFDCGDNVAAGVTCVGVLDGVTPVADGETLTLSSGSYTLVVTATDAAGNVSTTTSTFEVEATTEPRLALFVANRAQPGSADQAVIDLMIAAGFEVEVVDDNGVSASAADGKDVVIISASVVSWRVGSTFRDIDVPVVSWEGYLHAAMGFNRYGWFRNGETVNRNNTSVEILEPGHPIAVGLSGVVQVNDPGRRHAFGTPEGDVTVIGRLPGIDLATVFAYEQGADMRAGHVADARRVGLFMDSRAAGLLTADGEAIVLAAIEWAVATPTPINRAPEIDVADELAGSVGQQVALDAIVTDDALPAPGAPSIQWSAPVAPGIVTFSDPTVATTSVSFDQPGVYLLDVAADDGALSTIERVRVTVSAATVDETILFVASRANPVAPDRAVIDHLERLGYTVDVLDDNAVSSGVDLSGVDLVFVSTTVAPWRVGDAFSDAVVPLITNEHRLLDDLDMASRPIRAVGPVDDIDVVAPNDPLAAGFDGALRLTNGFLRVGTGAPAPDAVVVAEVFGFPVLFSYDVGDQMVGVAAPANRVFFPGTYFTGSLLTQEGFALLTEAVNVALS